LAADPAPDKTADLSPDKDNDWNNHSIPICKIPLQLIG
jgi:hypothetical protein